MTDDLFHHVAELLKPDYVVDAELGRGGMAVVYRGTDCETGHAVAIKVLPPRAGFAGRTRERFIREARIAVDI